MHFLEEILGGAYMVKGDAIATKQKVWGEMCSKGVDSNKA